MDLNDETLSYAYDGGSMINVTSPGAGVVLLNLTYTQALNLSDVIGIHLYMASGYNYSLYSAGQTSNNDWQHASFSLYYTATRPRSNAQYINSPSLSPTRPAVVPASGNFTVTVQVAVEHHGCDQPALPTCQRHHEQTYSYDGGALVQVVGPGPGTAGTVTMLVPVTAVCRRRVRQAADPHLHAG